MAGAVWLPCVVKIEDDNSDKDAPGLPEVEVEVEHKVNRIFDDEPVALWPDEMEEDELREEGEDPPQAGPSNRIPSVPPVRFSKEKSLSPWVHGDEWLIIQWH